MTKTETGSNKDAIIIKVEDWPSYQSYKDRRPPWIRFHRTMLDNYEYQQMTAEARALLPMLWLLASEHEDPTSGLIETSYEKIAFRIRLGKAIIEKAIKEIAGAGFILINQGCNSSVTYPYTARIGSVTTETETETEKRQRRELAKKSFEDFWKEYPLKQKKADAEQAYQKALTVALPEKILEGLRDYLANKPEWQDWAHPTSWLNQKRWEDIWPPKPEAEKTVEEILADNQRRRDEAAGIR